MGFCDRSTVRALLQGKRIALVGSGPGSLANPAGFVDSHDVVIRVNNYKLARGTGQRTDVFYSFFGTSIRKRREDLQRDGVKLCMAKCPDAKFMDSPWHERHRKSNGVDFRYIYQNREDWWFCPVYVPTLQEFLAHFNLLGRHVPTTGFSALLDVLGYEPANVFMTGFDFFTSRVHNLNERWKPANASDPIGHRPATEAAWLSRNLGSLPVTVDAALGTALSRLSRPSPARRAA